jgi:hypothetical protein
MLIYERLTRTLLMGIRVCTIAVLIFEWVGYFCSTFTDLGSPPRRILYLLTSIIISFCFVVETLLRYLLVTV